MADAFTLTPATTAADLAAVRALCRAYHRFLLGNSPIDYDITQAFYPEAKYTGLMDNLAHEHARPSGIILLARLPDGTPVGCGMTHAITPQTSEIKRVFVTDNARGMGVAAALCRALMDQARADGFTEMVLDTSIELTGAQRLYLALGFTPCGPYQPIPDGMLPNLVFYRKSL